MKLQTLEDVAKELFDDAHLSYDFTISTSSATLMAKFDELTVTNTEHSSLTHTVKGLYVQWQIDVLSGDEIKVTHIHRPQAARSTLSLKEFVSNYAHSHVRNAYRWSYICMGHTELEEICASQDHGDRIDEDSFYYVCYMLTQLFSNESEEGGPYHYIQHAIEDRGERIVGHLREESGSGVGSQVMSTESYDMIEVRHVGLESSSLNPGGNLPTRTLKRRMEALPSDDAREFWAMLFDSKLLVRDGNHIQYHNGISPHSPTFLMKLQASVEAHQRLWEQVRSLLYPDILRWDTHKIVALAYDEDSRYYANLYTPEDFETICSGNRYANDLESFYSERIFFKGGFVEKTVEESELLENQTTNYLHAEIIYYEQTIPIIRKIKRYYRVEKRRIQRNPFERYAASYVA